MIRAHARGASAGNGRRLRRQRGGDRGRDGRALLSGRRWRATPRTARTPHILMKVETHNHPTAIAPFPGAATGSGGEIRDEGATGVGAKPKAGLVGFTVSHLRIPGLAQPWEVDCRQAGPHRVRARHHARRPDRRRGVQQRIRPAEPRWLFPHVRAGVAGEVRGYHKPIMIAGGVGNIARGARRASTRCPRARC